MSLGLPALAEHTDQGSEHHRTVGSCRTELESRPAAGPARAAGKLRTEAALLIHYLARLPFPLPSVKCGVLPKGGTGRAANLWDSCCLVLDRSSEMKGDCLLAALLL